MNTHRATFVVPGSIDTRTGGSIYDRRMVDGLRQRGWAVEVRELDASFPFPTPAAIEQAAAVLSSLPTGALTVVDGLALSVLPDLIERETSRLRLIALVHLPVAADISLDREVALRLEIAERRALSTVALVIVTGTAALGMLERYPRALEKALVVEPGTDRAPRARGTAGSEGLPVSLLSVGTLNPGKGHDTLLRALASVPHREWHLTCAGSLSRDPETACRVEAQVSALELDENVSLLGELDDAALADCYGRADLFVLASRQETYGMAVAEALAHGLPIVSTTTGAIPDLVGPDAGILVPPGDDDALANALSRAIGDAGLRAHLAAGARRAGERLPTWEQASAQLAAALENLENNG